MSLSSAEWSCVNFWINKAALKTKGANSFHMAIHEEQVHGTECMHMGEANDIVSLQGVQFFLHNFLEDLMNRGKPWGKL